MTLLLTKESKRSSNYIVGERINAYKISEAIVEIAEANNISTDGLKSPKPQNKRSNKNEFT